MNDPGLPELFLERYRAADLPAPRAAAIQARIAADARLREQLVALTESDAQILGAYPPAPFAAAVARRSADSEDTGRAPSFGRLLAAGMAVAIGVVTGTWRATLRPSVDSTLSPSGDRGKGVDPVALHVFRRGGETVERLDPGAVARSADLVQIAYRGGGHRYGVIFSIDGRGLVTRHLPTDGPRSAPLEPGTVVPLATAYRLDDAPRLERIYFVASDEPFDVSPVLAALRRAGFDPLQTDTLPLGPGFAQASFLLRKELP